MRSRFFNGKSTKVSILSVKGPLNENRFRCMSSTGGNRDSDSRLVARRNALQFGQFLDIVLGECAHEVIPCLARTMRRFSP